MIIRRLFERRPPAYQYGRVAEIDIKSVKARVVTMSGGEVWCDAMADLVVGEAVVVSGSAPRFIVQRVAGNVPTTTTLGVV